MKSFRKIIQFLSTRSPLTLILTVPRNFTAHFFFILFITFKMNVIEAIEKYFVQRKAERIPIKKQRTFKRRRAELHHLATLQEIAADDPMPPDDD